MQVVYNALGREVNAAAIVEAVEKGLLPDSVKTACVVGDEAHLDDACFALVETLPSGKTCRSLPIVDVDNVRTSAFLFDKHASALAPDVRGRTASRLEASLARFGLPKDEFITKTACASIPTDADDYLERLFNIGTDANTELIANAFDACSPRGKRQIMFTVKTAGVATTPEQDIYGREDKSDLFPAFVAFRKKLVVSEDDVAKVDELLKVADALSCEEAIAAVAKLDEDLGLTHLHGKLLPDPVKTVVATFTEKQGSAVVDVDGIEYDGASLSSWLSNAGSAKLNGAFGDEFAKQFEGAPVEVLSSLPITHKRLIVGMMNGK